jgi:hypothetical protein
MLYNSRKWRKNQSKNNNKLYSTFPIFFLCHLPPPREQQLWNCRAQWEKVGQISFRPPIFFLPVRLYAEPRINSMKRNFMLDKIIDTRGQ